MQVPSTALLGQEPMQCEATAGLWEVIPTHLVTPCLLVEGQHCRVTGFPALEASRIPHLLLAHAEKACSAASQ